MPGEVPANCAVAVGRVLTVDEGPSEHRIEEFGLPRFELLEEAQHVEQVYEIMGVLPRCATAPRGAATRGARP